MRAVVYVVVCTFVLLSVVSGSPSDTCTIDEDKCKISLTQKGEELEIDLSAYSSVYTSSSSYDNRDYLYVPCGTLQTPSTCSGSKACQEDGSNNYPVGAQAGASCGIDQTSKNPVVRYNPVADSGGANSRGADVEFMCQEGASFTFEVSKYYTDAGGFIFPFSAKGGDLCPKAPSPSGGGGGNGIGGGGVFLIIYFVSIAIYLAVGVCYKVFYKGARGTEMLPNTEFWLMVPGLIRDGCLYIYRTIATKTCKKSFDAV